MAASMKRPEGGPFNLASTTLVCLTITFVTAFLWVDKVPSWSLGASTLCLGPRTPLGAGAPAAANRTDVEARILTQFEELEHICPWRSYISCHGMDRMNWTVAAATRTCCHTSPGLGQWNTFRLQTYRGDRQRLFAGGDVWNVKLTEKQTGVAVTTRVFDDGDGTYTVAFVPLYPGEYQVEAWLYYTRCLGFQDVPGNRTFPYTTIVSQRDWCFLGERVVLPALTVADPGGLGSEGVLAGPPAVRDPSVIHAQLHFFDTPAGRQFRPLTGAQHVLWRTSADSERMILVGDSTVELGALLMGAAQAPCQIEAAPRRYWGGDWEGPKLGVAGRCNNFTHLPGMPDANGSVYTNMTLAPPFGSCHAAPQNPRRADPVVVTASSAFYNRTFRIEDLGVPSPREYRVHYVNGHACEYIHLLLEDTLRNATASDTIIMNVGLHCVLRARFPDSAAMLRKVAAMLAAAPTKRVVWRTTDMVQQHEPWTWLKIPAMEYPGPRVHFLSEPRRLYFDLFARDLMRRHGIRILDFHGMPVDYQDTIHYDMAGFDFHNRAFSWAVCG